MKIILVQKGILNIHFKKTVCCLVFLFSFFFSFSSVYNDRHVYVNVDDETTIDSERLDYSEFSLTSNGHLNESPENPAEGESNPDFEKEKESETDDDKDELTRHQPIFGILFRFNSLQKESVFSDKFFRTESPVPFYILFHSWKSFLV